MRNHCVDLARIVINLPYMKEQKAKDFIFSPEYIDKIFNINTDRESESRLANVSKLDEFVSKDTKEKEKDD